LSRCAAHGAGSPLRSPRAASQPGAANESGTGIEGASPQKLTAGDYVVVPAETPHQFQNVQGEFVIMSVHMFLPEKK